MVLVYLFLAGLSILFTTAALIGWGWLPLPDLLKEYVPARQISIIIPVRNEELNISKLLIDLDNQKFPKELYEVVVVDDHSTDNTIVETETTIEGLEANIRIERNNGSGKKEAIETGIHIASGEVIVTTDGDCRVGPNWLITISSFMDKKKAVMVTGPVRFFESSNTWDKALMMEFAALQGIGAVTLNMELPTMCNGANLAYLKEAFVSADGYQGNRQILSGDDEFLMHKLSLLYPGRIHFLKSKEAVVETKTSSGMEWINQRRRWASKWEGYQIWAPKLIALIVFIFNLNILFGLALSISGELALGIFIGILLIKIIVDFTFITAIGRLLERKSNLLIFLALGLIYPFYVIFFGFLGLFGNYTWKGRTSQVKK